MPSKYKWAVARSPKSDPQRNKVYRMENEAIGAQRYQALHRTAIGQLVRSVCRNYRVPCPRLVWKDLGIWAAEWVEPGEIAFNTRRKMARDMLTVTHELAHHVHFHLAGAAEKTHEPHGPEFMAVHISILDTCRMIPVVGMRAVCDAYKIRYFDPGVRNSLAKLLRIVSKPK